MIVEIVLSLFVVWLTWSVASNYMMRRKMPPGPFPFPIVGNFPHMLFDPVHPFSKLAEKYGDIYTLSFPTGNTVVLNTATLVREARLRERGAFTGRSAESLYPFKEMLGDFASMDFSPKYVFLKKTFIKALHAIGSKMKRELSDSTDIAKTLLEEIESKEEKPFSPKKLVHGLLIAELWKIMTAKKLSLNDRIVKCLVEFGDILGNIALSASIYQIIPLASYLPSQFNRNIKRAIQIRKTIILPEFRAHLETYQPNVIRDLTDSFISAFETEISKQKGEELEVGSLEDIPGLMVDVFVGGSETTSSSFGWFLLYMVLHKTVQDKIHEEIDIVVGKDRLPVFDDVKNMHHLQASLCEVMRITSLASFGGSNAIRDTTFAGYHIPKGTFVLLNIEAVHHDEREWAEPDVFKPERFLDSEGKFVGWTKLHGFMPFSLGRRECTGGFFAKIMMLTFTSKLLHRYEIVLPEGAEKPSTKAVAFGTVLHSHEFEVLAKKRF